jgi:hypothetical protein
LTGNPSLGPRQHLVSQTRAAPPMPLSNYNFHALSFSGDNVGGQYGIAGLT